MKDVVEAIAVGIVGVVGELRTKRRAIDQEPHMLVRIPLDIDHLDFEPARQALAFGKLGVKGERFGALAWPSAA